jgi:hypothetical protein
MSCPSSGPGNVPSDHVSFILKGIAEAEILHKHTHESVTYFGMVAADEIK